MTVRLNQSIKTLRGSDNSLQMRFKRSPWLWTLAGTSKVKLALWVWGKGRLHRSAAWIRLVPWSTYLTADQICSNRKFHSRMTSLRRTTLAFKTNLGQQAKGVMTSTLSVTIRSKTWRCSASKAMTNWKSKRRLTSYCSRIALQLVLVVTLWALLVCQVRLALGRHKWLTDSKDHLVTSSYTPGRNLLRLPLSHLL